MRRLPAHDGAAWLAMTALLALGAIVVGAAGGLAETTPWSVALDWQPGHDLAQPWRLWTSAWVHWSGAHLAVNLAGAAVVGAVGWRARMPAAAALAWFLAWPLTQAVMALPDAAQLARAMSSYGGLSGVLHAGVVVLGLSLLWPRRGPPPRPAHPAMASAESGFVATRASAIEPSRITEGPWAMTSMEEMSVPASGVPAANPDTAAHPPALTLAQALRHRRIGAAIVAGTLAKVLLEAPWDFALRPSPMLGIQVAPIAHACGVIAGAVAWGLVNGWPAPRRPVRR